ncbi:MAG TPA: hypothetical protein VIY47_05955, partial [Ignavibacteriaceae bacterium]
KGVNIILKDTAITENMVAITEGVNTANTVMGNMAEAINTADTIIRKIISMADTMTMEKEAIIGENGVCFN